MNVIQHFKSGIQRIAQMSRCFWTASQMTGRNKFRSCVLAVWNENPGDEAANRAIAAKKAAKESYPQLSENQLAALEYQKFYLNNIVRNS